MATEITDADEISRCIIFDRAFKEQFVVDEHLWRFGKSDEHGASHESAILRKLAPLEDDVHRIGCAIAAEQNRRKKEPEPGPKRRYYCGFKTASYASLPKSGPGFTIEFRNVAEFGEEAHVDVALFVTVEGTNARAACKTNAGLALAEHFGPPAAHRCVCDLDDDQHPFAKWGEQCLTGALADRWQNIKLAPQTLSEDENDPAQRDLLE